jgi:hypothetical protein
MSPKSSPSNAPTSVPTPRTPPPVAPSKSSGSPSRTAASGAPKSPSPKTKPAAAPAPKPAPAAVQTLPKPDSNPASADEEAPWESLSSADTEDPSAKADTSPSKSSARKLKKPTAVKDPRRAWLVFGLIGVGALLVVTGLLVYAFRNGSATNSKKPLNVTKDADKPNSYRSILQALRAAQPGDVIVLHDAEHFENLLIEPRMKDITTDVTIQVAPGKEVVWKPFRREESVPLLTLQGARNFKIHGRGLTFDGAIDDKKRVQNLIVLNFTSPGLAIEDATLKGFGRSAVNVVNVFGSKEKWVRLANLHTISAAPEQPQAGLLFEANEQVQPPFNDFIEIVDVRTDGVKEGIKKAENTVVGKNVVWPK